MSSYSFRRCLPGGLTISFESRIVTPPRGVVAACWCVEWKGDVARESYRANRMMQVSRGIAAVVVLFRQRICESFCTSAASRIRLSD
jgi:hypothetical protein